MVEKIETFGFNVHMHDDFDRDDVHVELSKLAQDFGLLVSWILTSSRPFASKSIAMPNDLDEELKIAWEVLKAQLMLKKNMGHSI